MKKLIYFIIFFIISTYSFSQKYTISGFIEDAETGERLTGAAVFDANITSHGTVSNTYGFYSLTIPTGNIKLTSSFVGCSLFVLELNLTKDTIINIKLSSSIILNEVEVKGGENKVDDIQMGIIDVPLETIKKLPVILGETDIMKSIQMMPGVQGGTEGTSGIYVRGGGPDQNLILIDGVPVYNVSHLFGFFSVFNMDAISDFNLIKGGFPARYGGRLSSVIDVRMKEGNMKKITGTANIGILSSSFTIEGPIVKDKCSFIISARRSYLDLLVVPGEWIYSAFSKEIGRLTAGYFFQDLNTKINYKVSDKDRIFLSLYYGKDKLYASVADKSDSSYYSDKYNLNWGNLVTAFRWNHIFTPKLFANTTLTYSKFNYFIGIENEQKYYWENQKYQSKNMVEYNSSITDFAANIDLDYVISPSYKLKFGTSGIYHIFNPGITAMKSDYYGENNVDTTYGNKEIAAQEFSAYLENEIKIGKFLSMNLGGRLSGFQIKDTFFISPEPRISMRFLITKNFSIKLGYSKMQQYVHLLTNTSIGFPTDIWIPATNLVLPQKSTQYAVSTNFNFFDTYDFSIEGFYKEMNNLVEYKDGASLFFDFDNIEVKDADMWEEKVEQGKGWAYGVEFFLTKDIGKFNGWVGYTLSWSNRQFKNIAYGEIFPYTYDRRHDFAIASTYKFNERIDIGVNFVFSSGNAITLATSKYMTEQDIENYLQSIEMMQEHPEWGIFGFSETSYYGTRNNFRMPAYHRLDLGINYTKQKKHGTRVLSWGLYNAYCHLNPFFVEVSYDWKKQDFSKKVVYVYGLFPIIPSVSYSYKFK
jgi:outer membrane receptor for ferrienterochelin and colicin